ncbi:MAG: DUF4198 domain-containing protein [Burkholderiaceae bacterium]|nr:DUF4198 domain-containing protein [Burkholderiaceae bacterium]
MTKPFAALWLPLLSAFCLGAQAHTPYLLPVSFEAQPKAVISVDASFADKFFIPEVAFGETQFTLTAPDGSVTPLSDVRQFKTRTVAEHRLPDEKGTYRISTGPRLGAIFRSWERNGKVETARDPGTPTPADARLLSHYQSLSVSETYVTVGKPSQTALAPTGKGLEIVPLTHPSDLFAGEKFEFSVQYEGKPVANHKVEIFRSAMDLASQHSVDALTTDAQGRISYALPRSGVYLALVRLRADAPAGAAAPQYGNNYTLTFRVLAQ